MRKEISHYLDQFNKSLNLEGICWWVIDYECDPEHFYCNENMVEAFLLDGKLKKHSVANTCPIAGDYNKNIDLASNSTEISKDIFDDYTKLLNQELDQYNNTFPYYHSGLKKQLYFQSRATVLDRKSDGGVSVLYGIIIDITSRIESENEIKYKNKALSETIYKLEVKIKENEELKRREKENIYYATVHSTQHILNNLLNQLGLVKLEIDRCQTFNEKTRRYFDSMIEEASQLVEKLSSIDEVNEQKIKDSVVQ